MSLSGILRQHRWRLGFTFFLVLLETVLELLFPLFIGIAIDGALADDYNGAFQLGMLGAAIILTGGLRRAYDSRFYARIFEQYGEQIALQKNLSTSVRSARLSMMGELVEFFENSIPIIIQIGFGLLGMLIIMGGLNLRIFLACLAVLVMIIGLYAFTSPRTLRYNEGYNNELEKQVEVIKAGQTGGIKRHLQHLMRWNIRLSDLEVVNFMISWLLMIGFLVLAVVWSTDGEGPIQYGAILALIMYVFEFIDYLATLPEFYQRWLRLKEIGGRLQKESE